MSLNKYLALLCVLLFSFTMKGYGQSNDDATVKPDTTVSKQKKKVKNPQNVAASKAARMSAIVPGLGQIHNKKYWKLPIIYGGGAILTYFAVTNNQDYWSYKSAYDTRAAGGVDEYSNVYTTSQLQSLENDARRYRDMSILFGLGLYALNILDAYVDRHLMEFDVNDDLSLRVSPFLYTANNRQFAPGLTLNFALKK